MKSLILSMILLQGCLVSYPKMDSIDRCLVVQEILDQNEINLILNLDEPVGVRPYIRIFDLTNTLVGCNGFYNQRNSDLPVPYFVVNKLSTTINTGHYRDLVIHDFGLKKGRQKIVLSVSQFKSSNNVSTNFRIVINYELDGNGLIKITNTKVTDFIDSPPDYDYNINN